MLNHQKKWMVFLLLAINTAIFVLYVILDLLNVRIINNVDFTLLLIYIIVTFIVGTELVHERDNKNSRPNN